MTTPVKQRGARITCNDHQIEIVSCTPTVLLDAYRGAGGDSVAGKLDLLARALRKVDGREVTYLDARLGLKSMFPRSRHQAALLSALDALHAHDDAATERALASREPCESSTGYSEVVTLPDGRKVRLQELELRTVGAMLRDAQRASKVSEDARSVSAMLDCLRRSVVEVDGRPLKPDDLDGARFNDWFTVADMTVLYQAFGKMHGEDEEAKVYEMGE